MVVDRYEIAKSYFLEDSSSSYRYSLEDTWGFDGNTWGTNATYYIYIYELRYGDISGFSYRNYIASSNIDSKKNNNKSILLPSRLSDCTLKDIKVTELFLVIYIILNVIIISDAM